MVIQVVQKNCILSFQDIFESFSSLLLYGRTINIRVYAVTVSVYFLTFNSDWSERKSYYLHAKNGRNKLLLVFGAVWRPNANGWETNPIVWVLRRISERQLRPQMLRQTRQRSQMCVYRRTFLLGLLIYCNERMITKEFWEFSDTLLYNFKLSGIFGADSFLVRWNFKEWCEFNKKGCVCEWFKFVRLCFY